MLQSGPAVVSSTRSELNEYVSYKILVKRPKMEEEGIDSSCDGVV